ncbi:hypothetical protein MCOR27_001882 [Pyricularia oryzae]|uniref:Ribosomal lysine N-methyltransferase 4 n=2 Tax=Pyricularia TaxID=48558 RepID=A0ABQ8NV04_PYRGI|nr:hypothetical protein MCOR01_001161 [Pyricularia oryzae]KAI6302463.1 hypothetical protein MCOR33_002207 [Pyricularia grisea]KAH9430308.1 hypothetical protein MCOR02_010022 [Pyricularia oryzae]KAI6256451.1 hypothetical protein MCOR19_007115 [Pyricularia oryzae]KAI6275505.1 hypothetical protein MCOR26_006025 [Pyricularia oryzae]
MTGDSFEQRTSAFLQWFKNLPGATFHQNIQITDLRGRNAGRGIVATADIEPDTVLFTIPRKDIICLENSQLFKEVDSSIFVNRGSEPLDEDDEDQDGASSHQRGQNSWTTLILVMMYEHLRRDPSPWRPYLDVLPTEFETPMFWTSEEIAELQASPVVASIGREEADVMIRTKILPVIKENAAVFGGVTDADDERLVQLAHQMGSTIMAYSFDLEGEGDEEDEDEDGWVEDREGRTMMGMVPMADILNADAEFNAHINHSEEALVATALRKIPAGEEILNYYGPLPNGQLLRRYGYVTEKHSRYDVVELTAASITSSIRSRLNLAQQDWDKIDEARAKAMFGDDSEQVHGAMVEVEDSYPLERACEDPDEFGQLQGTPSFSELPEELLDMAKARFKEIKTIRPDAVPDKKFRDRIIYSAVREAASAKMAEYGTTLEEDLAKLSTLDSNQPRLRMAMEVRIGEKKLLHEAIAWLDGKIGDGAANGDMEVDEPASKRQRRA